MFSPKSHGFLFLTFDTLSLAVYHVIFSLLVLISQLFYQFPPTQSFQLPLFFSCITRYYILILNLLIILSNLLRTAFLFSSESFVILFQCGLVAVQAATPTVIWRLLLIALVGYIPAFLLSSILCPSVY